jgi:hypothetical protein
MSSVGCVGDLRRGRRLRRGFARLRRVYLRVDGTVDGRRRGREDGGEEKGMGDFGSEGRRD